MEKKTIEKKYPSTLKVHTPSGITYACEEHAKQIQGLMGFMGAHTNCEAILDDEYHECMNCKNEAGE